MPPAAPGVRHVRVPFLGIVVADDWMRACVDRSFHWPMIILALAILPLLAWEFLAPPLSGSWAWWISACSLAIIWMAFFVEFVIKIAIAESRFEYIRRNWLDLIVLLVPVLRPFRATYLVRTSRVFTLRGVGMKFTQYLFTFVIGLEATDRLLERAGLQKRTDRHDPREMTRHELMEELTKRRSLCDAWEAWFLVEEEHLRKLGVQRYPQPPPSNARTRQTPTDHPSTQPPLVVHPPAHLDPDSHNAPHATTIASNTERK